MQWGCTLGAARHAWLAGLQAPGQLAPAEVRRLREENAVLRQQLSKVDPQAGHAAVAEVDKLTAAMRETSRELRLVRGLPRGRHCGPGDLVDSSGLMRSTSPCASQLGGRLPWLGSSGRLPPHWPPGYVTCLRDNMSTAGVVQWAAAGAAGSTEQPLLQVCKERDLLQQRAEAAEAELARERSVHRRELRRRAKELADAHQDLLQVFTTACLGLTAVECLIKSCLAVSCMHVFFKHALAPCSYVSHQQAWLRPLQTSVSGKSPVPRRIGQAADVADSLKTHLHPALPCW